MIQPSSVLTYFPDGLPIGTIFAGNTEQPSGNAGRVCTAGLNFDLGQSRPVPFWSIAGAGIGAWMHFKLFLPPNMGALIRTASHQKPSVLAISSEVGRNGIIAQRATMLTPITSGSIVTATAADVKSYSRNGSPAPDAFTPGGSFFGGGGNRHGRHSLVVPPEPVARLVLGAICFESVVSGATAAAISQTEVKTPPRIEVYLSNANQGQIEPIPASTVALGGGAFVTELSSANWVTVAGFDPIAGAGPFFSSAILSGQGSLGPYKSPGAQFGLYTFGSAGGQANPLPAFARYLSAVIDGFIYLPQSYPIEGTFDGVPGAPAYPASASV